jgi:hypothetical protein
VYRLCIGSFEPKLPIKVICDVGNESAKTIPALRGDEKGWLCIVEFLPTDHPEARLFAADIIGYLVGCANLTNRRSLALLGGPDAALTRFYFPFRPPTRKTSS